MSARPTLGARLVVVCRDETDLSFFRKLFKAYEGISVVLDRRREQRRRRKSIVAIQQRRRERRAFAVAPVIVVRDARANGDRVGHISQAGLGRQGE